MEAHQIAILKLGFARRHVVEHNGGFVDERYARETGQGRLGERVRFRSSFVREFSTAAARLADRLEATGSVSQ
jgi:hypothetical protein